MLLVVGLVEGHRQQVVQLMHLHVDHVKIVILQKLLVVVVVVSLVYGQFEAHRQLRGGTRRQDAVGVVAVRVRGVIYVARAVQFLRKNLQLGEIMRSIEQLEGYRPSNVEDVVRKHHRRVSWLLDAETSHFRLHQRVKKCDRHAEILLKDTR